MPSGWDDPRTAAAYAAFNRAHPMYSATSRDLVSRAGVAGAGTVIDLCCGTGTTTAEILRQLPPDGRVIAVDKSRAMLDVAERHVPDPRVRWVQSHAEHVADAVFAGSVFAGSVDAVVCNSAIWQGDLAATLASVKRTLRPGGRLVFNLGQQSVRLPGEPAELPSTPGLFMVAIAYAILDHDYVLRPPSAALERWTPDDVASLVEGAGLTVASTEVLSYAQTLEQQRDWILLPVFGESRMAPLDAAQRGDVLAKAYRKLDGTTPEPLRWYVVVAMA